MANNKDNAAGGISIAGFLWRLVAAVVLVLLTYNPAGESAYHWTSVAIAESNFGPLHLILMNDATGAEPFTVQVAAPVRTKVTGSRGYRSRTSARFDCAWREYEGSAETLSQAWQRFAEDFAAAGLESNGEVRFVIHTFDRNSRSGRFEMQIGLADDS